MAFLFVALFFQVPWSKDQTGYRQRRKLMKRLKNLRRPCWKTVLAVALAIVATATWAVRAQGPPTGTFTIWDLVPGCDAMTGVCL